jgi:hypothetical protein
MSGSLRPQDFIANVEKAVESGLSKDEALRALTINAAEMFGASDQLGSIEVGKIANLVVASGDILAKDTKVRHVFIDGDQIELKKPEATPARGPGGRPGQGGGQREASIDPSGTWNLTIETPQSDVSAQLTLKKDGDQISGSLTSPMGTVPVKSGTINGKELRLTLTVEMGGQSMEVVMTGTIEGDSIKGSVLLGAEGAFPFSGTRPK